MLTPAVVGIEVCLSPAPRVSVSVGIVPERLSLLSEGLPLCKLFFYRMLLYSVFIWLQVCLKNGALVEVTFLFSAQLGVILSFLQDCINKQRTFSTVMVYLAAVAACHVRFEGQMASHHPLLYEQKEAFSCIQIIHPSLGSGCVFFRVLKSSLFQKLSSTTWSLCPFRLCYCLLWQSMSFVCLF